VQVAQDLLGQLLVVESSAGRMSGWIVEVEAYLAMDDPACHASRGKTKSNATMFDKPGCLYVYPIHAKHCMNIVTEPEGIGAAVLIRAIEPKQGLNQMKENRSASEYKKPYEVTNGPGKTCAALGVDRRGDGIDLVSSESIWVEQGVDLANHALKLGTSRRIGVSQATTLPLRFFIDGNRFVSGLSMDHLDGRRHTLQDLLKIGDEYNRGPLDALNELER
jgi:DNA-3-methyladenine glycosylase